jgi:hypothetical protein
LSSGHIGRCILHGMTAYCETDFSSEFGLPSSADPSSAERKSSTVPGRTDIENPQASGRRVAELEYDTLMLTHEGEAP